MIQLNRSTEYALLALSYLYQGGDSPLSVAEIAEHHGIPKVILSKVMQNLKNEGLVRAVKGRSGGYVLDCDPASLPLLELLRVMNESVELVGCRDHAWDNCAQSETCKIRGPVQAIESAIARTLSRVYLIDIISDESGARIKHRTSA